MSGLWDWSEKLNGCTNVGSYSLLQTGSTFAGAFGQAGNTCSGFSSDFEGEVVEGSVSGDTLRFRAIFSGSSCEYVGIVSRNQPRTISGTVNCGGNVGTWRAYPGAAVLAIAVEPAADTVLVNGWATLRVVSLNATGDRLFLRPVVWSSNNPSVATVSASGLVKGVGPGAGTIIATVEGKTAVASLTAFTLPDDAIAFESSDGIEVMDAGGSWRAVMIHGAAIEPAWSPDGSSLALTGMASRWDLCGIWVARADLSEARRVTSSGECDHSPAWSPDGTRIAFARGDPACFWHCMVTIHVADPATGSVAQLAGSGTNWNTRPTWSPDGSKLAFESYDWDTDRYDIFIMSADGSAAASLTRDGYFNTEAAWSPNGDELVFVRDGNVWRMQADGSRPAQLTSSVGFVSNPAWSADGSRIMFVASPDDACGYPDPPCRHAGTDLYVMLRDGTQVRRLTQSREYEANPSWRPVGRASASPGR